MQTALSQMFPKEKLQFRFLYDSSHGTRAQDFDAAVRGVGPILILIKAATKYVFGAYVNNTFGTSGWMKGSKKTFLFSFGEKNAYPYPIKLLNNRSGYGILDVSQAGLHLNTDLRVFPNFSCEPTIYTKTAPGYSSAIVNNTLLAGVSSGIPEFIEIFAVSKYKK